MASFDPAEGAKKQWHIALKLRKHLQKQLSILKSDNDSGKSITYFADVDKTLEQLRLACMGTIFMDFEYALSEGAEDALWQLHVAIRSEYRRSLGRLRQASQTVERRKVEHKYHSFLRTAQQFYKGYIQRLALRYDIPELRRAACGIEAPQNSPDDMISPVPADLRAKLLSCCHSTMIRLGDLARYRAQARTNKTGPGTGFETALTYYGLAHDLIPDSGFALHQMGIINLEECNHLDVVYHFYRAWAVKRPHPNAQKNLELEFNELKSPQKSPRGSRPQPPQDPFIMWFVRLHGLFYTGDQRSSQHNELESEVIHRLEMAAKDPTSCPTLLKMSLVNMAAYSIACAKRAEHKTDSAARFCQYTLHLSVRFIRVLCEAVEPALKESIEAASAGNVDSNPTSPLGESLIPVLRIYTIWLAACRQDLFSAGHLLGGAEQTMIQSLARVITLLCADTFSRHLAPCTYLLLEDVELRGLQSLSDEHVPPACRPYCDGDGQLKPHLQVPSDRLSPSAEFFARVLDTLRTAYFLAEDPVVPLAWREVETGLVFEHQPNDRIEVNGHTPKQAEPMSQPQQSPTMARTAISSLETTGQQTNDPVQNDILNGHLDDADNTVLTMLSPFLDCPSPTSEKSIGSPQESSYGMHTTTANELLAQEMLASFKPEPDTSTSLSITPGQYENLPWNWVYSPVPRTPQDSGARAARGATSGPQRGSDRSSKGSIPNAELLEDPFVTPGRWQTGNAQGSVAVARGSPLMPTPDEAHRSKLLQSFTAAGLTQNAEAANWGLQHNATQSHKAPPAPPAPAAPAASPWGQGVFAEGLLSSDASRFSHQSSSMYHGTPQNGVSYGVPSAWNVGQHQNQKQNESAQEDGVSLERPFQIDDTASSYDAKILRRAMHGAK